MLEVLSILDRSFSPAIVREEVEGLQQKSKNKFVLRDRPLKFIEARGAKYVKCRAIPIKAPKTYGRGELVASMGMRQSEHCLSHMKGVL